MRQFIHLSIILLVVFSLGVETYIHLNTDMPMANYPISTSGRLLYYYSYFTILSNLSIAVGSLILLFKPNYDTPAFRVLRVDGLICILITAIVYNLVLRQNHPTTGVMIVTNEFLHVIIPFLALLSWLVYEPRLRIDKKTRSVAILPPLLYLLYIFIRGEISGVYPYPFMDASLLGLPKALLNTSGVVIVFILLEYLLWFIDKKLSAARP